MKKTAIFVFFILLACNCFTQNYKNSIELGVAFPYFRERKSHFYQGMKFDYSQRMSTIAVNIAGVTYSSEMFGIGGYANFIFPQRLTNENGSTLNSYDFEYIFALDALAGPVYNPSLNNFIAFPIAVGLHYKYFWYRTINGPRYRDMTLGLGANITGEFRINNNIFLFARIQTSLDLLRFVIADRNYNIGNTTFLVPEERFSTTLDWGINPAIGIGLKL